MTTKSNHLVSLSTGENFILSDIEESKYYIQGTVLYKSYNHIKIDIQNQCVYLTKDSNNIEVIHNCKVLGIIQINNNTFR